MNIVDLLKETFWSLSGNKARSILTVLGIVIGIGSVITMVSIGQGAKNSIQSSIQSIGSNLILVMPGFQRSAGVSAGRGSATTLTQADATAIQQKVSGIKAVASEVSRRYQVTAKGTNTNTQVTGTVADYQIARNVSVAEGSFITDAQDKSAEKVAVLGPTTRDDLFGQGTEAVGQTIKINSYSFKIIGITTAKGGSGFTNPDDAVYLPLTTAQHLLAGNISISDISISAQDATQMASIQQEITNLLLQRHNITDPTLADFSVINQADIVSSASSITNTLTILLASIAGISLLVGGIGIMNMMLTTVTERTREIGLRKSIGAKRNDITAQFLLEAIALTLIGGAIGIVLGWLASLAVASLTSLSTSVSMFSVILAVGVSALVGIIFGYYPARRAASLNPIEALRYE